jgi:hypothetical protein
MNRGEGFVRRCSLASLLAVAALITTSASPAGAAVTIGQTTPNALTCADNRDRLQLSVTSGNSYVVPSNGTITSWSTDATPGGGLLAMKVYRSSGGSLYTVVGHEGPRALTPGILNTFPANIAVKAGDVLGSSTPPAAGAPYCFSEAVAGNTYLSLLNTNLADGQSGNFLTPNNNNRLNVSAVVVPTNSFTLGAVTRNKKKGTATLTATVPNSGELTGSGKGVKVASAARISKTVSAPGAVKLTIKAKGKKKKKLNETGKVKVNPTITYTPTGGDPRAQSIKVKLKKNL